MLEIYAKNNLNVMLIGTHGIGKTARVNALAQENNLKLKYFSASTLDPWVDIIGIPAPDMENNTIKFLRSTEIENAEFLFFDELNRASPRVLNAILEIVQFKSVNGVKLPKLRMVWAAINPPGGDYQVEDLDPALMDRFHVYVQMESKLDVPYLLSKYREKVVTAVVSWYENVLKKEHREHLTPRRAEYLCFALENNVRVEEMMPLEMPYPVEALYRLLGEQQVAVPVNVPTTLTRAQWDAVLPEIDDKITTAEGAKLFIKHVDGVLALAKQDPEVKQQVANLLGHVHPTWYYNLRPLFAVIDPDFKEAILTYCFKPFRDYALNKFNADPNHGTPDIVELLQKHLPEG
jgi:hypothetical protein